MCTHTSTQLGSTKCCAFLHHLKCFWSKMKLNYYTTKYSDLNKKITRRFMSCDIWQCGAAQVVPGVSKDCSGSIFRVKQTKLVWAAWPWSRTNYNLSKCCIYPLQDAASHPGRLSLHQRQTKTSKLKKELLALLYILVHVLFYVHTRQQTVRNRLYATTNAVHCPNHIS